MIAIGQAASTLGRFAGRLDEVGNRLLELPSALLEPDEQPAESRPVEPGLLARAAALQAVSRELDSWSDSTRLSVARLGDASSTLSAFPLVADRGPRRYSPSPPSRWTSWPVGSRGPSVTSTSCHESLSSLARAGQLPLDTLESVVQLVSSTSGASSASPRSYYSTQNLGEARAGLGGLHARTFGWIRWIAAFLSVLLLWFGAGQASLLFVGFRSLHEPKAQYLEGGS